MGDIFTDKEANNIAYRNIVEIDEEISMRETLHNREIEKLKRKRAMFEIIVNRL